MRLLLTLAAIVGPSMTAFTQQTTIYRTADGTNYSQDQKDSIATLGFPIAIKERINTGDTAIYMIDVHDKSLPETPFKKRFAEKPLPTMKFADITGTNIHLPHKGKVTFVNFWSVTCGPCIVEIPQLNELYKKYNSQVLFVAISPDPKDQIEKFLSETPFHFNVVSSPDIFSDHQIDGYPKNLFIDKRGKVIMVKEGTPYSRKNVGDDWAISVFDDYSIILESLLSD